MNVLRTHPFAISNGIITQNPYYIILMFGWRKTRLSICEGERLVIKMNVSLDLLLLISNLSQLKNRERILQIFVEAINSFHSEFSIFFHESTQTQKDTIEIATAKNKFGTMEILGTPEVVAPEFRLLLQMQFKCWLSFLKT